MRGGLMLLVPGVGRQCLDAKWHRIVLLLYAAGLLIASARPQAELADETREVPTSVNWRCRWDAVVVSKSTWMRMNSSPSIASRCGVTCARPNARSGACS